MIKKILAVLLFAGLAAAGASAQLQSSQVLNVSVVVSVSTSVALQQSGGSLTISPTTGASNSITFLTSWTLDNTQVNNGVKLFTWFSNPNAALSVGSTNIAASNLSATWTNTFSSGSGNPCNQAPGIGQGVVDGGACSAIGLAPMGSNGSWPGNNISNYPTTYSLSLLNYANNGLHLAAGNYSGTLNALVLAY